SWDEVLDVVKKAVAAVERRCSRVSLVLKADARAGQGRLDAKVASIERHLAGQGS
ncbi:MAG: thiamine-binding protein, partial [Thermobispora bispora]|nr:thiamine-binding protein [Thermobispora bispora]